LKYSKNKRYRGVYLPIPWTNFTDIRHRGVYPHIVGHRNLKTGEKTLSQVWRFYYGI